MILNFFNSRFFLVFLFPFILGTLTVFSFQPFNLSYINFAIIPILFLLTTYVQKRSKNTFRKKPYLLNLFLIGYLFGVGFFLTGTHWISHSLTFDDNFKFLIPVAIIGLPIFLGVFFGIANLLAGPFLQNNFVSILLFSSSYALMDYLRAKILSGFPWNAWAYTWSWKPEILQPLFYFGGPSFSFCSIVLEFFFPKLQVLGCTCTVLMAVVPFMHFVPSKTSCRGQEDHMSSSVQLVNCMAKRNVHDFQRA